jgi:TonB-linked outer membrane protein, SusC/RagA family
MSKRLITALLVFLTMGAWAFAQTAVSGRVTDASGEPLVGVNVLVKGTTIGTMTDYNGNYSLNVKQGSVLVFSSIGFANQEVTVGSQKNINVTLKDDTAYLDEVVVVGYGTARKKDVSGAIASVNYANDKNITALPNPNALAALSSKVAGFSYAPTTSAGGDNTATMTIRGKNAIPAGGRVSSSSQSVNQPLLVVDGVLSYGSINSINTADIQSIDVLKDASAAAIYGSRAANGVIIITTKSASSTTPRVDFNASLSLSDWTRMPKMVTDKETFLKNRFYSHKFRGEDDYKNLEWSSYASLDAAADQLLSEREGQAWDKGIWTNWLDEISRTGVGQKYDVAVSGRGEKARYYVSSDYTRQQGIRKGDDYEKAGAMAKIDFNVTDWLQVGVKGNFLLANSWGQTAKIQNAIWMTPLSFVHAIQPGYEDWYNSHPDGNTASPYWGAGTNDSHLWTDRNSKSYNLNGVGYAQIDFPFLKGLSYRITLQGQHNSSYSDVFNNPEIAVSTELTTSMDDPQQFASQASGTSSMSHYAAWNIDQILTYGKDFGRNHFDVMLGYTREHTNNNGLSIGYNGFSVPTDLKQYNLSAAENWNPGRTRVVTSAIGYLFRANYNFANTYYATFNFRRDGYSAFGDANKWGNFYGASFAWVLSNEGFIKDIDAINFLKLRASWGQNGSRSVSAGATFASVGKSTGNSGVITMTWLGDQSTLGMTTTSMANPHLSWATVEKYDLGLDFSLIDNRVNGSLDVYAGNTTNMLVLRSAPYFSGFSQVYDNVGKITNKGVELVLNTVNINGNGRETLRWESNIVFDSNANKLVSLFGPNTKGVEEDDVANAVAYGFDSYYALQVGHPIGSAYDYKMLGIFQNEQEIADHKAQPDAVPGDIKFEDIAGAFDADGNPIPDGKINDADMTFLGSPDPLFTLNFGNTFSWKNFSLYFNFRWAQGDKTHFLWFDPHAFGTDMRSGNQLARVKPWNGEGSTNVFPRYGYNNTENNAANFYRFWNQRSFLKLKDLVLSYNIDPSITKKIGLSATRIYFAATDLLTISNWSGIDPENAGTIAAGAGSDRYGSNGAYKTVTVGVNLSF